MTIYKNLPPLPSINPDNRDDKILAIQKIVSEVLEISLSSIQLGRRGQERESLARMLSMGLCALYVHETTQYIAGRHGKKDHGTVLHACKRVEAREFDLALNDMYNRCLPLIEKFFAPENTADSTATITKT